MQPSVYFIVILYIDTICKNNHENKKVFGTIP